jgi:hypothetical protein
MNPLDDYFMAKEAADAPSGGNWGPALRNAAVMTGAGLATAALPIAAGKVYNAVNKKSRFNSMMGFNDDLHAMAEEDPKRFAQYYDSLHRMSPDFAADPIVAGTYMRQMLSNPSGAGKVLVEARGGTKNLPNSPVGDALRGMGTPVGKSLIEGFGKPAPEETPYTKMRKDVDQTKLEMEHQETMQRAQQMGIF